MRALLLLAFALLLAWAAYTFVDTPDEAPSYDELQDELAEEGPDPRITASDERVYAPGTLSLIHI